MNISNGRSGRVHRLATLSFVKLLLCAQSLWQTHRSGREVGRDALPTVQRQHYLSRKGFPHNTVSARMEEFIGWTLRWTLHGRGTGQVAGLSGRKGTGPEKQSNQKIKDKNENIFLHVFFIRGHICNPHESIRHVCQVSAVTVTVSSNAVQVALLKTISFCVPYNCGRFTVL